MRRFQAILVALILLIGWQPTASASSWGCPSTGGTSHAPPVSTGKNVCRVLTVNENIFFNVSATTAVFCVPAQAPQPSVVFAYCGDQASTNLSQTRGSGK